MYCQFFFVTAVVVPKQPLELQTVHDVRSTGGNQEQSNVMLERFDWHYKCQKR